MGGRTLLCWALHRRGELDTGEEDMDEEIEVDAHPGTDDTATVIVTTVGSQSPIQATTTTCRFASPPLVFVR